MIRYALIVSQFLSLSPEYQTETILVSLFVLATFKCIMGFFVGS